MSHIPEAAIASMSGSMRDHLFWVANASPSATPYPGRNIATMRALERRGLVVGDRVGDDGTAARRPVIAWRLTDKGHAVRSALAGKWGAS